MLLRYLPLVVTLMLTSGCNSLPYSDSKDLQTESDLDLEDDIHRPLCKYKEIKGISEIVDISDNRYVFMFFPGDNRFVRVKKKLAIEFPRKELNQLQVGHEVRSIKQSLVSGHARCSKGNISLIPVSPH